MGNTIWNLKIVLKVAQKCDQKIFFDYDHLGLMVNIARVLLGLLPVLGELPLPLRNQPAPCSFCQHCSSLTSLLFLKHVRENVPKDVMLCEKSHGESKWRGVYHRGLAVRTTWWYRLHMAIQVSICDFWLALLSLMCSKSRVTADELLDMVKALKIPDYISTRNN